MLARQAETKSDIKVHLSSQSGHKDHRDELASSSGSLTKQVYMSSIYGHRTTDVIWP